VLKKSLCQGVSLEILIVPVAVIIGIKPLNVDDISIIKNKCSGLILSIRFVSRSEHNTSRNKESKTMNLKINDIERFFCDLVQDLSNPFSRDISYWTVDGMNFDTWGKEHSTGGEGGYKQWITTIVIPNLKKRFDILCY